MLALTGAQADAFAEKTAAMGEAAGATDRAFKIQTNSVSAMASKLKNAGSVMLTSLGEKALPYVQDAMQGLIDRMPAITETLGGVIERAGPMFGVMASGISNAVSACAPVVGRIGSMFSGAFAAAQPAIASLRDSFMAVLPTLEPVVLAISEVATSVIPPLAAAFAGIGSVVAAVMPIVSEVVSGVGSKIAEIFGVIGSKAGILQQVFEAVAADHIGADLGDLDSGRTDPRACGRGRRSGCGCDRMGISIYPGRGRAGMGSGWPDRAGACRCIRRGGQGCQRCCE